MAKKANTASVRGLSNMKTVLIGLVAAFMLSGCGAHMQTTTRKSTPYAPTNEVRGGTVSYLDQGASSVRAKRRESAYKQMHDYCQGDYKIVSEAAGSEGGTAIPVGGMLVYGQERKAEIKFECADQKASL